MKLSELKTMIEPTRVSKSLSSVKLSKPRSALEKVKLGNYSKKFKRLYLLISHSREILRLSRPC